VGRRSLRPSRYFAGNSVTHPWRCCRDSLQRWGRNSMNCFKPMALSVDGVRRRFEVIHRGPPPPHLHPFCSNRRRLSHRSGRFVASADRRRGKVLRTPTLMDGISYQECGLPMSALQGSTAASGCSTSPYCTNSRLEKSGNGARLPSSFSVPGEADSHAT